MEPNWKRLKTDFAFRERMAKRTLILDGIRAFFKSRGFLEVETPVLVAKPGMEPNLDPFETVAMDERGKKYAAHLITSPEYAMKKLLAAGLERIFEITRCFRNGEPFSAPGSRAGAGSGGSAFGGSGLKHNPEFTMIEWYRANADYTAIMADTEQMVHHVAGLVGYSGRVDLTPPWPRLTVTESFARYAGIDLGRAIDDPAWFRSEAVRLGCTVTGRDSFDDVFFKIFLRDIEPKLGVSPEPGRGAIKPVILYEYPRSMAALARLKKDDPRYAERFEAYCGGLEMCNAFSELNDAAEQRRRLEQEREERRALGKKDIALDEQFLEAVGMMPASAGIALGIDRLVMLLTDGSSIEDVLFFPARDIFSENSS